MSWRTPANVLTQSRITRFLFSTNCLTPEEPEKQSFEKSIYSWAADSNLKDVVFFFNVGALTLFRNFFLSALKLMEKIKSLDTF